MPDEQTVAPEDTAARAALWRALHVEVDDPPHVFEDEVGLELVAPAEGWRSRPDMSPFTRAFRARRTLLCGQEGWSPSAEEFRGAAGREDLAGRPTSNIDTEVTRVIEEVAIP